MFHFQTMCYTSPMTDLVALMVEWEGKLASHISTAFFRDYHVELINVLCEKRNCGPADLPEYFRWVVG